MTTPTLRDAEQKLSEFLAQYDSEAQESIVRYALDHVVPRLKRLALTAPEQSPADGGQAKPGEGATLSERMKVLADTFAWTQGGGEAINTSLPPRTELFALIDHVCVGIDSPAAPTSGAPVAWADPRDLEDATDTFIVASCEKRQIPGGDKLRFKVPLYAPPSAAQADGARKALEAAGRLLMTAHRAAIKLGLRDRGSDCSLSHEVRMFALAFSEEGRDGPGELQTRGTGEYRATRKLIEAALTAAPEKLEPLNGMTKEAALAWLDGLKQQAPVPEKLAPAPQQAAQGGERERFAQAMVEAGYHHPERGPFNDSQFKFERDEDRFVGWQLARAAQGGREGLTDEQRRNLWRESPFRGNGGQIDWFIEGTKAAERYYGITTPAGDSE